MHFLGGCTDVFGGCSLSGFVKAVGGSKFEPVRANASFRAGDVIIGARWSVFTKDGVR